MRTVVLSAYRNNLRHPITNPVIDTIRGAVNGLMAEVLECHIREHLGVNGLSEDERRADVNTVASAVRSYLK